MNAPERRLVEKRGGPREPFDKAKFIRRILNTLPSTLDSGTRSRMAERLANTVSDCVPWPSPSPSLDRMLSEIAAQMMVEDPIYGEVAANVELSDLFKVTEPTFSRAMCRASHLLAEEFLDLVRRHRGTLDDMIRDGRDNQLSFLAIRSLKSTYLLKDSDGLYERPQYLWLRSALQTHGDDIESVRRSYDMISTFQFMPASPILFNSGTRVPQLSSCYLITAGTRVEEIFDVLAKCANISQGGGGIGLGLGSIPCQGYNNEGEKNAGLVPILKMFDATSEVIERGKNKRPSAITAYIEPWHPDVLPFIRMKRVTGDESTHTNRLFYGLLINDLFMKRVDQDKQWTLFCPSEAPRLADLYGDEFEREYVFLESGGMGKASMSARDIWKEILRSQVESGGPFILYKEALNQKSNEREIGTITQSNLCTEIVQYCDKDEVAVCNLASVVLPSFVRRDGKFDFVKLGDVVRQMVLFLNCVVHRTATPGNEAHHSLMNHRAIGIGLQGLADTFAKKSIPFESEAARKLNSDIAETIYYTAVDESCNLIKIFGAHPSFPDCPSSNGWLQHHYWPCPRLSGRYNWKKLSDKASRGMANSLLVAYMPTAGTSQLTGCSECFEPYNSLIYTRKLSSGQYLVIPEPLVNHLKRLDLWKENIIQEILANRGTYRPNALLDR